MYISTILPRRCRYRRTYGALGAYVTSHAIGVEGPVRESYLVDPRTPPAGWHTEIGWPVFGVR
ncbi:MAG TPA: hypothetical protein VHW01_28705 [Polyangiaceae bacterium]|jgi:effector-binding domain-containing protein|nr:hypothetical protein [Polyangiaceae bacterium]